MTVRRGRRTFIRENFACDLGGCGAAPGESCRAYVPKPGKTTGGTVPDVHAARWRAYHAWLRTRQAEATASR